MKKRLWIILPVYLMGCFGTLPETRYYLLDYIPTPSTERLTKGSYSYSLRVKEFRVAEAYRRPQMIYRQSAHELKYYNYQLWAVKPEQLVTDMVVKHLNKFFLFDAVTQELEENKPDFVLSGEITAIEEYDNKLDWYSHLAIRMELRNSEGVMVWQKPYDFREKVAKQEPVYVVRGLSALLENIMDDVSTEMEAYLSGLKIGTSAPKP